MIHQDNSNRQALSFTREQSIFKRKADKLVKEHIAPNAEQIDRDGRFPVENIQLLGREGLLGLGIRKEFGGIGGDTLATTLVIESIAKGCASTAMAFLMHISTIPLFNALVNYDQIEAFLKPIIQGEWLGALAMSEPTTGSRLWHMESYAEKNGDLFNIDSFKSFATSGGHANFYIVPVRTDRHSKANELSVFLINGKDPNVQLIGRWDGMGLRGNSSTPVHFKNCQVPAFNRLGDPNCGFSMLMAYTLPIYFIGLSAVYLGIAQNAYDAALAKVKQRKYADTQNTASDIETVQRYVGEMKTKLSVLRESIYKGARLTMEVNNVFDELSKANLLTELLDKAQNDKFFVEIALLKIAACETAQFVADKALQVSGGQSYKRGHIVERCYRDARAGSLMGPSDDILKVMIGKRELGLPYPWDELQKEPLAEVQ